MWCDQPYKRVHIPLEEEQDGFAVPAVHMAIVHNSIILGINSIVDQAPYIKPNDAPDFIGYSRAWVEFVVEHHDTEETVMFPMIATATNEPEIMSPNLAQHRKFTKGLEEMDEYLISTQSNPSSFSGQKLVQIIESFGAALTTHLTDEIPTLIALRKFGEKLDMEKIAMDTAIAALGKMGIHSAISFFAGAIDKSTHGEKYAAFPPIPPIPGLFEEEKSKGYWRFSPCTPERVVKEKPELGPLLN